MRGLRAGRAVLALAIIGAGAGRAEPTSEVPEPPPQRVLVLSELDPGTPASMTFTYGLRMDLDPTRYAVEFEFLDRFRFPRTATRTEARDWLRARYALTPPEVIVAVGEEAIQLLATPETSPWPGVPVVYSATDGRAAAHRSLPPGFTGIVEHWAAKETVALALQLFPATRHVAMIGGTSPTDKAFVDVTRRDLEAFAGRFEVIDLVGLPTAAMLERLRTLPDDSIVLGTSYLRDGTGQLWTGHLIVPRITAVSRAPLFAMTATILGHGIVGGVLVDFEGVGRRVGQVVRRILAGEAPAAIPISESGTNRAVLDGRQLDRWRVPDSRVPEGVEVRFREPSLWTRNRWPIIAALSALGVQAALIVGLLLERRRRRLAEARSREDLAVVAHLNRVGAIGELAGAFAHELNSPLGAVVNNAQAARRFIAGPGRIDEVAACLDDIIDDARRAGEVVRRIRAHLRREEIEPAPLDVRAVIRDAIRLVEMDARDRQVELAVDVAPDLPPLKGDDVQLVQVVLNLVMNALDALEDVPAHRRQVRVGVASTAEGVEIQVADTGPGIPPAQVERLFDPFFTTKASGLGLGLSISRSIVEAHGGAIRVSAAEGGGAIFRVLLPAAAGRGQEATA
jgi:signal transduction histidine kinase